VMSTSDDGVAFTNVLTSKSTGSTLNLEKYNVVDTNARYIRIIVNGNTQNSYASIAEVTIKIVTTQGSNYYIGAVGDWGSARNDNWEKTVDLMINNKINLALGLGDYSYGTVEEFRPVVDTLKTAGIQFKGCREIMTLAPMPNCSNNLLCYLHLTRVHRGSFCGTRRNPI
jgi:hypothetical protein